MAENNTVPRIAAIVDKTLDLILLFIEFSFPGRRSLIFAFCPFCLLSVFSGNHVADSEALW